MRIFVDTNVVVDFLTHRPGFYEPAASIFQLAKEDAISCIVSSLTIVNCAYLMRKVYGKQGTLQKLTLFVRLLEISPIDQDVIERAMLSDPYDFEDAVQYQSAILKRADLVITRDKKGFREFPLPVMSPVEFLQSCQH